MWVDKRLPALRQHPVWSGSLAFLFVGCGVLIKLAVPELPPFLTLFPAILLSAFVGGQVIGMAALAFCCLAAVYFISVASPQLSGPWQIADVIGFALVGILIVFVVGLLDTSVQRLQRERRRLTVALKAGGAAIWEIYPDGKIYWDENFYHLVGLPPRKTPPTAEEFLEMVHPEDRPRMAAARQTMNSGDSPQLVDEYRIVRPDGSTIWLANYRTWINSNGRYFIGFTQDITSRKANQKQIKTLMAEVAHRVKNQYAVILAMVRETNNQSRTKGEMETLVTSRIQALSKSHDLLVHGNWEGASLGELIREHIEAFGMTDRLTLEGQDLKLSPNAAQYLGLAFHELATNSTKHGAFATPEGFVRVSWTVADGYFTIEWRESGMSLSPDTGDVRGFGSKVLERLTPAAVGGKGKIAFLETGLVWILECPVQTIVANTQP